MTSKERANNLVDGFLNIKPKSNGKIESQLIYDEAKQCALICVDELIELYEFQNPHRGFKISYWDEVKTELEKL